MEKLIVIRDKSELPQLINYINDHEYLSFDTETTGLDRDTKVIGFSIAGDIETAFYVILKEWDAKTNTLVTLETDSEAKSIIALLQDKKLIMHNAVFDCTVVNRNFGIDLMASLHTDTMILGHLLNENRHNGLKELGVSIFGEDARAEQLAMKESVKANGGVLTKKNYELYKADSELIGKYGAKDTILTLKLFYHFVEQLFEEGLDEFFYTDESMPLLRGPTYDLNFTGLKVDMEKLAQLRGELESNCLEAKAFIYREIDAHVKKQYPGTNKRNTFNIGSGNQLGWLLFEVLRQEFRILTKGGKELCKALGLKLPYAPGAKIEFIREVRSRKGQMYEVDGDSKKIGDYWKYLSTDKVTLQKFASKYKWVEKLLFFSKELKLLNTYVIGIQERQQYGVIYPSFLQHGTTSGRYSSRNPNFQNLPRDDKRVKKCIVSRPGKAFVGADYSQLEPRVFASMSQDETLMSCFAKGEDFYSVVGAPIFGIKNASLYKNDENSFAKKHPNLRDKAKIIALATPYGRTAHQQADSMNISRDEAQSLIDNYFDEYPKVEIMMLTSHEEAKKDGRVFNIFGRPRRIPEAKQINKIYGTVSHAELPYTARTLLNLAMNHKIQSTGASIVNRAAIKFYDRLKEAKLNDKVKIVLQVHDELVIECPIDIAESIAKLLKYSMENTVQLPGVKLEAEPKIANNLADLK